MGINNNLLPDISGKQVDSSPAFHVMAKPHGAICNLDCKYCYYLSKENLYPGSKFRMDGLLEFYIQQYIHAQPAPEVNFAWQGGEPTLMGLEFFRKAIAYQKKHRRPGTVIQNSLQTNGILLDAEWGQFLKEHGFLVGVSLDGPQPLHDAYRVDRGGRPTHARVMRGIEVLKRHKVDFNILCCVHAANADQPLEVYRFLRDEVPTRYIQFIPIVERENKAGYQEGARVTTRSVNGWQYGHFLISIFDEWAGRDIGNVFVQLFDVCLGVWLGQPASLCSFAQTCGLNLAMEHNGDLYSCDHFVEPGHFLGNIRERGLPTLINSEQQIRFGLAKRDELPRHCRKCEVRFICNGGCPKDRIRKTPQGEPGLNYLCEGYKSFFLHIDEAMKIMAALIRTNRPPSDLMAILERRNKGNNPSQATSFSRKRRRSRKR